MFQKLIQQRARLYLPILIVFNLLVFALCVKINVFRFNNFDFGKFDLGNMSQMVWYTLNGKLMYLTDYFGTNLPRWAMSHVDPILLIFIPVFIFFPHSLTLVFGQVILVLSSSIIIYKLGDLILKSSFAGLLLGVAFLFYPAVGFLLAWTGYHGVTAVIPFFLLAFYIFEKMHLSQNFSLRNRLVFWVMIIATLAGKEQLSLYILVYGVFIALARKNLKYGLTLITLGAVWFVVTFVVIIPHFAPYRVDGFKQFSEEIQIDSTLGQDVGKDNYFLSRYSEFGDTYLEITLGILFNPSKSVEIFFGGDKLENFNMTMAPLLYVPLLAPLHLAIAGPDFLINYLTTSSGIGTAEVYNHRVSMIIPLLFIACIYFIAFFAKYLERFFKVTKIYTVTICAALLLISTVYHSKKYENPVFLWLFQAVQKRISYVVPDVYAQNEDKWLGLYKQAVVGEQIRVPHMDTKDRSCASKIVKTIPDGSSVSGPDYLGAHLALRETYALFPALYTKADVVIADIFSQKVFGILGINRDILNDLVGNLIKHPDYELASACGNLFVFNKVGPHNKTDKLPIQEYFRYEEKFNYPVSLSLYVVDYDFPTTLEVGKTKPARFVFIKRDDDSLTDYFSFISLVNVKDNSLYQVANISSFGLKTLGDWEEGMYYEEKLDLAVPKFVEPGLYRAFVGITNQSKTRSLYLGEVVIK